MRLATAALLVLFTAAWAHAESPAAAELRALRTRYNEDLPRLDRVRAELADVAKAQPTAEDLVALAEACFIWGDVRARTADEKLAAYAEGRDAARRAIALAPRSVLAHFWYGATTGRWGQTKGIMRSLFLVPTVKQEIETIRELDPAFAPGYSLAGYVYYELPAMLGGDLDRAEQMFRRGLALDPRFTSMRVGLAQTLIKKGRVPEARRELEAVLAERSPSNPADWAIKDSPKARALLASLGAAS
jgi:tetratricopeptide (TPR) repeat protein